MFEILFKYPFSLFHKGQFVFLTPWPMWLMAAAILAAAGLLFWHVHRNHGMLSGLRPVAIWVLEACMVALILFLLWHPALSVATLRPQQNVVAILVDDSRSMSIADSPGTREAAAKAVLDNGLLKALGDKFQVRLYKFGKEPERIQKTDQLAGTAPASRIGDTLERVLAESSSLPLGALVLLSDGADNAGGIDLQTISAIRRQRIPVHTVGFGREHPDKDVEVVDAVVPARALPQSKLTAVVALQSYGLSGGRAKLTVRDSGKVLASEDVVLKADGQVQSETLVFNCGDAGPKTLDIGVEPISGEDNALNNRVTRLVNVEARKPRILYFEGEPRWEYKFIGRALDDYEGIELARMLRTTQNKLYRQFPKGMGENELEDGFPSKPEELFQFQGLIIGSVEANYFTPAQQQLIHDFVDRRGGGLLLEGGRASLSDGGYQNTPLADLAPVKLPEGRGTFHRDFTGQELTAAGAQSILCRLDDDPARNLERWKKMPQMANYQEVGDPKPGATVLLESTPAGKRKFPLLATENYGRGRTMLFATEGTWRWKMWMDHADKTHAMFWQQILRYLVADTPGQVVSTTPKQVLSDETRVPIRVEVRDKQYKPVTNAKVQARFTGPEGISATMELTPVPLEEGIYGGEWTAEKSGTYVTEIIAGREQEEVGRDMLTFRREDGVAENFHTSQNRELLEKLSQQTGGRYYRPDEASKLASEISYSEAGITTRETRDLWDMPAIFLLALGIRAAEWLLRRKWGVV
ncbi:MAG TPA: glutamine amidotransferase [Bryobacteraceae bacterium]|nr:glutamine amidotransferase [Bryobacteraceae bacterium]